MFDESELNHDAFDYYPPLARVKRFVDEHYADPIPLATAARIAGMERTYFSRYFHHKTGVRFRDWLAWTRVGRATDLLASRDASITEVAFEVGFQDLRTFERAVEKCLGCSPRQVKRRVSPEPHGDPRGLDDRNN